jgi:hypothetical protein
VRVIDDGRNDEQQGLPSIPGPGPPFPPLPDEILAALLEVAQPGGPLPFIECPSGQALGQRRG